MRAAKHSDAPAHLLQGHPAQGRWHHQVILQSGKVYLSLIIGFRWPMMWCSVSAFSARASIGSGRRLSAAGPAVAARAKQGRARQQSTYRYTSSLLESSCVIAFLMLSWSTLSYHGRGCQSHRPGALG